jgi:ABC-type protease/lipase transport system fused ATPase/permease subunit
VVAHRTGILADADKLLVLNEGRVQMFGSREEMYRRSLTSPTAPPAANEQNQTSQPPRRSA